MTVSGFELAYSGRLAYGDVAIRFPAMVRSLTSADFVFNRARNAGKLMSGCVDVVPDRGVQARGGEAKKYPPERILEADRQMTTVRPSVIPRTPIKVVISSPDLLVSETPRCLAELGEVAAPPIVGTTPSRCGATEAEING
jgi:hypothetical protein